MDFGDFEWNEVLELHQVDWEMDETRWSPLLRSLASPVLETDSSAVG